MEILSRDDHQQATRHLAAMATAIELNIPEVEAVSTTVSSDIPRSDRVVVVDVVLVNVHALDHRLTRLIPAR